MLKIFRLIMVVCLGVCLPAQPVLGCRYNVRDVGFVDLDFERYSLYGYVDGSTPNDVIESFGKIAPIGLAESNVRFELIHTGLQKEHPAIKYLDALSQRKLPAAVLVSPTEKRMMPIPITTSEKPFAETLQSAIHKIVSSPKRQEIIEYLLSTYGVVVLIEGPDSNQNQRVKQAAGEAIDKISPQLDTLPKAIAKPPCLVTIPPESFDKEKVLLWSLGLDAEKIKQTYAVVLYARGRMMARVLEGEQITNITVLNILSLIGLDCECGLDRKWMEGAMLPLVWDKDRQARAAKNLGFDPENPMVKVEVSQILGRRPVVQSSFTNLDDYPTASVGYQEIVVEFEADSNTQWIPFSQIQGQAGGQPAQTQAILKSSDLTTGGSVLIRGVYIISGLAVLIVVSGLIVIARARRRSL